MPSVPEDPEAVKAAYAEEVDDQVEQARDRAERATAWRREVEALLGHGTADGGGVRVSVRPDGLLTDLRIRDASAARGARAVERAVLEALTAAQAQVRSAAHAASVQAWGERDNAVNALDAEVRASTPPPQPLVDPGSPDGGREGGTW